MFHIIPNNFFVPLSSPNRIVYWECISRLFAIMEHQFSFGVEREVLVDELEFYFGQENAAQLVEEEFQADDSRSRLTAFCAAWNTTAGSKWKQTKATYSV